MTNSRNSDRQELVEMVDVGDYSSRREFGVFGDSFVAFTILQSREGSGLRYVVDNVYISNLDAINHSIILTTFNLTGGLSIRRHFLTMWAMQGYQVGFEVHATTVQRFPPYTLIEGEELQLIPFASPDTTPMEWRIDYREYTV
jgi:hypothetical protein